MRCSGRLDIRPKGHNATEVISHRRNLRPDGEVQQLAVCDRYYGNDFKEHVNDYNRGVLGSKEQQNFPMIFGIEK